MRQQIRGEQHIGERPCRHRIVLRETVIGEAENCGTVCEGALQETKACSQDGSAAEPPRRVWTNTFCGCCFRRKAARIPEANVTAVPGASCAVSGFSP